MYVDDIFDKDELLGLQEEVQLNLDANPGNEQSQWDMEDITQRINQLTREVISPEQVLEAS
ncbi:hypothetical protein ASE48_08545 [Mycobacterium sp. Root265]|uniref:hypothetical protein n=1 Tax=Mycobacterium sp. Root265 TaxID=1736504 RepID=UPI00070ACD91|nr:hypothetical protein [Mycobacterium sp. Root265]KRD08603.1 hypothetical protein ASE48_08545 [Mycobacterium sp. Root265]